MEPVSFNLDLEAVNSRLANLFFLVHRHIVVTFISIKLSRGSIKRRIDRLAPSWLACKTSYWHERIAGFHFPNFNWWRSNPNNRSTKFWNSTIISLTGDWKTSKFLAELRNAPQSMTEPITKVWVGMIQLRRGRFINSFLDRTYDFFFFFDLCSCWPRSRYPPNFVLIRTCFKN